MLALSYIAAHIIFRLQQSTLILKHGAVNHNKSKTIIMSLALLPFAKANLYFRITPLAIIALIGAIAMFIGLSVFKDKMLETVQGYVIQSFTIWLYIETFIIDVMIGVIPLSVLMVTSIVLKGIGIWYCINLEGKYSNKVYGGIFLISIIELIRMYMFNILIVNDYIPKVVLLLVCNMCTLIYFTLRYKNAPTLKIKTIAYHIPHSLLILFADIIYLVLISKGVHKVADYGIVIIAGVILIESRLKLNKKQWVGLILLLLGWIIIL